VTPRATGEDRERAMVRLRQPEPPQYTDEETAKRRDEVIRRMANTPPQPKTSRPRRRKTEKKAGVGRVARKGRASREG
jgi:hypothetical protein